jgi:hypothetical protein
MPSPYSFNRAVLGEGCSGVPYSKESGRFLFSGQIVGVTATVDGSRVQVNGILMGTLNDRGRKECLPE